MQMDMLELDHSDGLEHTGYDGQGNITVPPLLPIPATLAKPGDRLCDVCKALKLTPRQFIVFPSEIKDSIRSNDPVAHLGRVKDMRKKTYCPLCRLILYSLGGTSLPQVQDRQAVRVSVGWDADGLTPGTYPVKHYTPVTCLLEPRAYKGKKHSLVTGKTPFPRIAMLAHDAPTPSQLYLMRIIGDQIDFNIVQNALRLCKKWHGSACDRSPAFYAQLEDPATDIPHFRLIDTKDNCIVLPPKGSTYVTLSYVWGNIDPTAILRTVKANIVELAKPGSLLLPENHDRIPATIRDAVEVVRKLNLRYLWVDSLCIIQDDDGPGGSKMSAISKMDLVYGGALLTIAAATGIDANAGLPGVRPGTRGPDATQVIEELYPGLRVAYKGPPIGANTMKNEKSVYSTRAWM